MCPERTWYGDTLMYLLNSKSTAGVASGTTDAKTPSEMCDQSMPSACSNCPNWAANASQVRPTRVSNRYDRNAFFEALAS